MQNSGLKLHFLENLEARLELWAPAVSSVQNFQLSDKKNFFLSKIWSDCQKTATSCSKTVQHMTPLN